MAYEIEGIDYRELPIKLVSAWVCSGHAGDFGKDRRITEYTAHLECGHRITQPATKRRTPKMRCIECLKATWTNPYRDQGESGANKMRKKKDLEKS